MIARNRLTAAVALFAALGVVACGSDPEPADDDGFPPVAEPAEAPPLTEEPAGDVIAVGSGPEGLAVDGETGIAALGVREPPSLQLVDVEDFEVVRTVGLPAHPRHLQLEGTGGPVLVPAEDSDELVLVDLPSGGSSTIGVGDFPHDATAAAGRIFVGDEFGDTVSVIEGEETVEVLDAPVQPGSVFASGGVVAVIAVAERVLTTYDPDTLERFDTVPAGEGPTHIVAAGKRAFVADTQGDAILEYRLGERPELVGELDLEGTPYGIAIDSERQHLWVTLTALNELVRIDLSGSKLKVAKRYPAVEQPNTVGVDPRTGTVLISGATQEGTLQRIRPVRD